MAWVEIPLTHGKTTLIDCADADKALQYNWHLGDTGYAVWRGVKDGKRTTVRLHRLIANTPDDLMTDHLNHDTLDNRRSNLRSVTQAENMRNRTNQGRGYWFQRQNNNWVVEINGKHRGTFETEQEAIIFAKLVREGKADMKPTPIRRKYQPFCKHGHSMVDAYTIQNDKRCRTCQRRRSAEYNQRKKESRMTS
jgi:hypothetical protein